MSKRAKGSLRSSRGGFFSEPARRSPEKRRAQRIKFRRRYANSVMKRTGRRFIKAAGALLALGVLGYGGFSAWNFWQASSRFRVSAVQFEDDIPPALAASLPVKAGNHLFGLELEKIEEDLKQKFPELERLTISRRLNRSLTVAGRYKKAEALYEAKEKTLGVAADGTLFPVAERTAPDGKLVMIGGRTSLDERRRLLNVFRAWKKDAPAFWTLVKRVETDSIGTVRVILEGDVVVQWGEMIEDELLVHAGNILNVLDRFMPVRTPAALHVVSRNRIVMDSNWKKK